MADERGKDDPPLILNPRLQAEERINYIIRFTRQQRREREWINFHEIAEWYAERNGRFDAGELDRAYDMLQRDLFFGDFEGDGRSRVLYSNPHLPEEPWMTQAFFDRIIGEVTDREIVHLHLSRCWIPWRLFGRWLENHGLPLSPRFEPQDRERSEVERKEPRKKSSLSSTPPSNMRQRGRSAEKRERTIEAMRRDVEERGVAYLRDMREKELEATYRVSRDTARKARNVVLSESVGN